MRSGTRVRNKPIREAVEQWLTEDDNNTWSELANLVGWTKTRTRGGKQTADVMRAKRALGLTPSHSYRNGTRYLYNSENIAEGNALRIIEAIGRSPNEFDL